MGFWEQFNNPGFNSIEFDGIKNLSGKNKLQWCIPMKRLCERLVSRYEAKSLPISNVLFVVDNYYYNEKLNHKYTRYFENDLANRPLQEKQKEYQGNLYFFEGDSLVQILRELPKE